MPKSRYMKNVILMLLWVNWFWNEFYDIHRLFFQAMEKSIQILGYPAFRELSFVSKITISVHNKKICVDYSGPSDIRTPDIRMLQYPDDFSWEQIFLTLFCLIYPEFRVPDPEVCFYHKMHFYIIFWFTYPDGRFWWQASVHSGQPSWVGC